MYDWRGVNSNGTSVEGEFGFYVYIRSFRQPEWKDFSDLGMFADQTLNMLAFADTADFVEWQHGFTPPSHLDLTDSELTVTGTAPITASELRMRAKSVEGYYQDLTFNLRVIQTPDGFGIDTPFDYIVEIEGVDISDRLSAPGVRFQHSLDIVRVNRYAVSDCNIPITKQ